MESQCPKCKAVYSANRKLPTRCKICNCPMHIEKVKEKINDKS